MDKKVRRRRSIIKCGGIFALSYNIFYTVFFTMFDYVGLYDHFLWLSDFSIVVSLAIVIPYRILQVFLMIYLTKTGIKLVDILGD